MHQTLHHHSSQPHYSCRPDARRIGGDTETEEKSQRATEWDRDTWRAKAIQCTLLHNHGWQEKMRLYIIWWIQDEGGFTLCLSMRNWACPAIVTDHRDALSSSVIPPLRTPWYVKDARFWKDAKKLPRGSLDRAIVRLKLALSLGNPVLLHLHLPTQTSKSRPYLGGFQPRSFISAPQPFAINLLSAHLKIGDYEIPLYVCWKQQLHKHIKLFNSESAFYESLKSLKLFKWKTCDS